MVERDAVEDEAVAVTLGQVADGQHVLPMVRCDRRPREEPAADTDWLMADGQAGKVPVGPPGNAS